MRTFIEYETATGRICAVYQGAAEPVAVPGRAFVDVTDRPDAVGAAQYDAKTNTFEPPPPAPAAPAMRPIISRIAFLRLLTAPEYAAFVTRAQSDATVALAKAMLEAAIWMSADEPTFQHMLAYCVGVGVFTQDRANAIVAAMQA